MTSPTATAHADAVRVLAQCPEPEAGAGAGAGAAGSPAGAGAGTDLRQQYADHLAAHPDALDRGGPPSHLTASCLVLDRSGERALLVLHRKGGFWVQPGGHVEPGDLSLAAAALREAREETGLPDVALQRAGAPFDLHRHALAGFGRCREHLDVCFLATAPSGAAPVASAESRDAAWWPVGALPSGIVADLPPRLRAASAVLTGERS